MQPPEHSFLKKSNSPGQENPGKPKPAWWEDWRTWASLLVTLALIARILPGPRTIDDAYITFRYARNILSGDGMVYNPGEWVLGTTTPLYAGLLSVVGLLFGGAEAPFPEIAMILNALADAGTVVLVILIGKRSGFSQAGLAAALVWSVLPFSVTFAIGGLETSVYILLLSATIYAHMTNRPTTTAFFAVASLLTRPDALILLGPLALDRLLSAPNTRRFLRLPGLPQASAPVGWREITAAGLPLAAWIGFAWGVYGSPLPHSIAAKSVAYQLPKHHALIRLVQHYATPFMDNLTFGIPAIAVGIVLYPFLFLIGARRLLRTSKRLLAWIIYPWFYFIVFSIANPLIFRWYLTPPLLPLIFVILCGIQAFLNETLGKVSAKRQATRVGVIFLNIALLGILPTGMVLRDWTLQPDHGLDRPAPAMAWYLLELKYKEAADLLRPEIIAQDPSPLLAAGDVGVLGYYSGARILDTVGLNSPEAVPYYPTRPEYYANVYAVSPELILDQQPEYVVLLEVYGRLGLFRNPDFLERYSLYHTIPTDIYGSEGMLIFRRNP